MIEKWLEIDGWSGYFISNTGMVRRGDSGVALVPNKNRRNYVYVYHHSRHMKPRALSVHRLVARYFIANPLEKPCVNHIDNDTQNNISSNLEWVTHQENTNHAVRQGRMVKTVGESCPQAKLTESIVRQIKALRGVEPYTKIAARFNTNYSNVAHIMRGSRWAHVK